MTGRISKRTESLLIGLSMASPVAASLVWGWEAAWIPVVLTACAAWNLHEAFTSKGSWRMKKG
jgi:hypothetical protein